jgi:hypothetical protein
MGLSLYGVIVAALGLWFLWRNPEMPIEPIMLAIIGIPHLLVTLMLSGEAMSTPYDGQLAWRERFHLDDNAVHRLGRAVIRLATWLPFILAWAFSRDTGMGGEVAGLGLLAIVGLGTRAIVRGRTWGVLAIGAAGLTLVTFALTGGESHAMAPALCGGLLLSAASPFAGPIARALRA